MPHIIRNHKRSALLLCSVVLMALLVAACGGATNGTSAIPMSAPINHSSQYTKVPASSDSASGQHTNSSGVQQYLIKTLNISMEVKDTQQVANNLQAWISTTDPLSTAQNINYQQVGDNLYNVNMTFSVQASLFPRIENYLNNYPILHNGRLLSTAMSTQDVSNDYIDTQSRLINLRGEQDRLLTLMSHASALGDILSIDQRLTDVEGQMEQIEAHLNDLNGQTTFYNISISLQPSQVTVAPQPPAGWSIGAIWQSAFSAAIAIGQGLISVLIWLAAFSIYIVPLALIAWFVRRWRRLQGQRGVPAVAVNPSPPPID